MSIDVKIFEALSEFTEDESEIFLDLVEVKELDSHDYLFQEGSISEGMFFVLEGTVAVETREQGALGSLGKGEHVGSLSLIVPGKRTATARAVTDCQVLLLERFGYRRLIEDAPRAACKLQEAILREFAMAVREGL